MSIINLKDFDGLKLPEEFHLTKERIEHFEVRNDDVWVTSYPKCGTTWCQEMVWLIANNLNYEGATVDLGMRFPYLESKSFYPELARFSKKHNVKTKMDYSIQPPDVLKLVENTQGVRYIKSHLAFDFLPRQIIEGTKTPKIIHVMRNPKQVAPSYFNHMAIVFPMYVGTLGDFVDFYVKGELLYGDYFRTVLSYWKERNRPNLLILTYEEMHKDLTGVIRRVCDFLGKTYSEEKIAHLARHLSINEMRKNAAVNKQNMIQDDKLQFFRKGGIDSYKEELTPDMISKLDRWVAENVRGTGLPYENCRMEG